jgi:hypothetical protein
MKLLLVPAIVLVLAFSTGGCKSSSADGPKLFCDTACLKDTLKFAGEHTTKPFVYISPNNCKGDTIIWAYTGIAARKTKFDYPDAKLNKDFARCIFKDNEFAYILFNDCATGRGFQIKLPYDKTQSFVMKTSGINNIDPKFSIADNLLAYTDRGNIYIEEIATGKKAMMTFGEKLDIDYDAIHEYIDSVNVTNSRIWVKVKIGEAWKDLEKKITLE